MKRYIYKTSIVFTIIIAFFLAVSVISADKDSVGHVKENVGHLIEPVPLGGDRELTEIYRELELKFIIDEDCNC